MKRGWRFKVDFRAFGALVSCFGLEPRAAKIAALGGDISGYWISPAFRSSERLSV